MPQAKDTDHVTNRTKVHSLLDMFFDLAEKEELWGDIEIRPEIRAGKIIKINFSPKLGTKFAD